MPQQPHTGKSNGLGERQFIGPERMILGGGVGGEHLNRFARLDGVAGERWIRDDPDKTGLGEGARGPALGAMTGEPWVRV